MKMDEKYLLDSKLDYLKLTLKISKLRYHGDEPPEELLQQTYEIGRLVGISEMELRRTYLQNSSNAQGRDTNR